MLLPHKNVVGSSDEREVGDFGGVLSQLDFFQVMLQERQVVGTRKHIVVTHPERPKIPREPGVLSTVVAGILAGHIEIDYANVASRSQVRGLVFRSLNIMAFVIFFVTLTPSSAGAS